MKNLDSHNDRSYRILADPLSQLMAYVIDLESLYQDKNKSTFEDYISFLQNECLDVETKLNNTLTYLKTTHLKDEVKQRFLRYSKRLNTLLFEFEKELKTHNISRNIVLENAFDFEIEINSTFKPENLLPNYLEIEKEFKDFIKNDSPSLNNNRQTANKVIFIDNSSYQSFDVYMKDYLVEPFVDLSYLFQRLLERKIISHVKHLDFAEWLFQNKYISESTMDVIIKNNGFRSLSKSTSAQRENNFNIVFNLY